MTETSTPDLTIDITVDAEETGQRVDRLLAERLADLSRSRLKALIEDGRLTVDGATITNPSMRVKPGQRLLLNPPPPGRRPARGAGDGPEHRL